MSIFNKIKRGYYNLDKKLGGVLPKGYIAPKPIPNSLTSQPSSNLNNVTKPANSSINNNIKKEEKKPFFDRGQINFPTDEHTPAIGKGISNIISSATAPPTKEEGGQFGSPDLGVGYAFKNVAKVGAKWTEEELETAFTKNANFNAVRKEIAGITKSLESAGEGIFRGANSKQIRLASGILENKIIIGKDLAKQPLIKNTVEAKLHASFLSKLVAKANSPWFVLGFIASSVGALGYSVVQSGNERADAVQSLSMAARNAAEAGDIEGLQQLNDNIADLTDNNFINNLKMAGYPIAAFDKMKAQKLANDIMIRDMLKLRDEQVVKDAEYESEKEAEKTYWENRDKLADEKDLENKKYWERIAAEKAKQDEEERLYWENVNNQKYEESTKYGKRFSLSSNYNPKTNEEKSKLKFGLIGK
jgi:hypothetical protein